MKKQLLLLTLLFIINFPVSAQMVQQNESFESATSGAPAIFPSPGWKTIKYASATNAAFSVQAAASAVNPVCGASPGGGFNLLLFNSFSAANNDTALVITKPFDFSNNGGVNPQFSFYMYRDNGWLVNDDHIRVYINTQASLTGATLLSNTAGTDILYRRNNGSPAATANSWNQYTYDLPAATYNGKRCYFIIMGVCRDGNNIYLDQVRANTYPSAMNVADVSVNLFQQNLASASPGVRNHMIVGIRCIVGGNSGCGVVNGALSTALKLDSLLLNTNGTTNVLDIDDAKVYYTGGSVLFDTNYVSPFPVTAGSDDYPSRRYGQIIAVPGTNIDFTNGATSCFYLEYDTTYFWLAYDVNTTAAGGNVVDANLRGAAAGGTPGTCPSPGATGSPVLPASGGYSLNGASTIDLDYCTPTYYTGTSGNYFNYTNNDYLQSVVLNGAGGTVINTNIGASNNNTGIPATVPCYPNCDFTAHPPDYELWSPVPGRTVVLTQGISYVITVQAGTWPTFNAIAVFIDFNRDGDFLDVGEKCGQVTLAGNASSGITFMVPSSGYTGLTRMRIREVWAASNIDPCASYGSGETEDFVVSIAPNCPVGDKLWLGNTEEWNNPANWCGGVPSITDNAVVDAGILFPPAGVPSRPYFNPVIPSGVTANCDNLTISSFDTLVINAAAPATNALKVRNDLTNNGKIAVSSSDIKNVLIGNGNLSNNIYTPFKAQSTDARTQIIYSGTELSAAGLVAGDRISSIQFSLFFKGSTAAYTGFTVSYALVPFAAHSSNVPYAGALTGVFGPTAFSTVGGTNTLLLQSPIVWDGTSNLLIQYCFDNAANTGSADDRIFITETTGIKSTLILSTVSNASPGCALLPGAGVTDNFFSSLGSWRPNFTFRVERPYGKVQINVQKDWINNGSFTAGYSRVLLDSTIAQSISGTSITTFNELQLNKGAAGQSVSLSRDIVIDTALFLNQGSLLMGTKSITMKNPAPSGGTTTAPTGPFTRVSGFLISDNAAATVIWKNVNTAGYRVVPFGSEAISAPVYIPFSYTLKSGTLGDMTISTYKALGNLPWPPTVTHFNPATGPGDNAAAAVDRFWLLSKTGSAPVADVTFRFAISERPLGMTAVAANQGRAQPWKKGTVSDRWLRLISPFTTLTYTQNYAQVAAAFVDSVRVVNWDWPILPVGPAPSFEPSASIGNSNPWTISINSQPCGDGLVAIPQISIVSLVPESCPGSADGAIGVSVTGGNSPYAYQWSDGSVVLNRTGLSAGTYTLTVTDSNGSTATTTVIISVSNQFPATPSAITGSAYGVCNATRSYYVSPVAGITYTWTVPAGATVIYGQGTDSVRVQFSSAFTSGQINVTASNLCGNSAARTKTIKGRPKQPDSISGPTAFCNTDTVTFSTPSVSGATSYIWTVPIGVLIINGQNSNSITVTGVMSYLSGDICVKTKNSCGSSGYYCKAVVVNIAPQPISSISGNASGVCGQTISYSVPAIPAVTYNWTIPSGAVLNSGQGSNNISVTYATANISGSVSVTVSGSCGAPVSATKSIKAKPISPAAIIGPGNICYNLQNVSYSCPAVFGTTWYNWTLPAGAGFVSGQGTTNVVLNFNGTPGTTVQLKVNAGNSCGSSSNQVSNIILNNCPRMASTAEEGFTLYPNPAGEEVMITWNNVYEEKVVISCIDILGQVVLTQSIHSGSGEQQLLLNTSTLAAGVYVIRLQTGEENVMSRRLVVE